MDASQFTKPNGTLVRAGSGSSRTVAFLPRSLPPSFHWSDETVSLVSTSDRALGQLVSLGEYVPNPHLLIAPFIRREAVLSSRIEGTQATVTDLYLFEAMASEQMVSSDVHEVHNYVEAIDHGLEQMKRMPLSRRMICDLHRILMTGVRGQERRQGEFRRIQNWIGPEYCTIDEATYVPPPPPQMDDALDDLEKYINEPSDLPPLVRLALIHYQFEAIHPFEDGNGRIGRLLITLSLCIDGILPAPLLYISDYFERRRADYYARLLAVSTESAWEQWIQFFLRAATDAARDGAIRAKRLFSLQQRYRDRFAKSRSSTVRALIDMLFITPAVSMPQAAKSLDTTATSIQRAIDTLMREGILRESTGAARNRIYVADGILEAIGDRSITT